MTSNEDFTHDTSNSRTPPTQAGTETAPGTGAPQHHAAVASVPLPPVMPIEENRAPLLSSTTQAAQGLRDPGRAAAQPSVEPDRWVHETDFWGKETMIAMTGRYPVPRPKTRPLPPPHRFRPVARWKSVFLLGTLVVVTILACAGTIELEKLSTEVFGSQATPVVTQTAQPTVSPTLGAHK